jgi:hypothetical protein
MPRGRKSQRKKSQRKKSNRAYRSYRSNGSRTKRKTNSPRTRRSYKRNINYRGFEEDMKDAIDEVVNTNSPVEDSEDYNPTSPSPLVSPASTPPSDPPKGRTVRAQSMINSTAAPVLNLGPPQFNAQSTQLTPNRFSSRQPRNPQSPASSSSGYNAGGSSASSSIDNTPTRSLRPTDTSSEYRMQPFLPVSIPSTEIPQTQTTPPSQIPPRAPSGPSKRRNPSSRLDDDEEEEEDETQGRKKKRSGL